MDIVRSLKMLQFIGTNWQFAVRNNNKPFFVVVYSQHNLPLSSFPFTNELHTTAKDDDSDLFEAKIRNNLKGVSKRKHKKCTFKTSKRVFLFLPLLDPLSHLLTLSLSSSRIVSLLIAFKYFTRSS